MRLGLSLCDLQQNFHLLHIFNTHQDLMKTLLFRWTTPKFHPLVTNTKKVFSLDVLITFSVLMGRKRSVVICVSPE